MPDTSTDAPHVAEPGGSRETVALALGGGGARGVAYIGVFRVLEDEGLLPDFLVGTSIGALAAVMWAHSHDWQWVKKKTLEFLANRGLGRYGWGLGLSQSEARASFLGRLCIWARRLASAPRFFFAGGLYSAAGLREAVAEVLPAVRLEQLRPRTAAVALDLVSGDEVILESGDCREACCISANLAGFFRPHRHGRRLLVDASSIASVPVDACRRLGAGRVAAVDLRSPLPTLDKPERLRTALDAVIRLGQIGSERANQAQLAAADCVIRPDVGDVFWSDFRDVERLEAAGERAARERLPALRRLFGESASR